ncbi:MAG: hypothetical protein LBC41_08365 [Clostridiales bacterium]|jgi:hypothetical protein|nr:hypothetical protein [Clostridiales bacterium]MDR2750658.1 hypothetical protein [Clostridiales bacterium]
MRKEKAAQKRQPFFVSAIIALLALAVIVPLALGFQALKMPYWPILAFVFYTSAIPLEESKFPEAAVGGLAGIFLSYSSAIFGAFLGKGAGELIFLILLAAFLAILIDGRAKYVNQASNLYLMCATAIDLNQKELANLLPVVVSYAIGVIGCFAAVKALNLRKR